MHFIALLVIIAITLCEILLAWLRGKLTIEGSFSTSKEHMGFLLKNKGKCFFILSMRPTLCELEDGDHTFTGWGDQEFDNGGVPHRAISVSFLNITLTAIYEEPAEEIPKARDSLSSNTSEL